LMCCAQHQDDNQTKHFQRLFGNYVARNNFVHFLFEDFDAKKGLSQPIFSFLWVWILPTYVVSSGIPTLQGPESRRLQSDLLKSNRKRLF